MCAIEMVLERRSSQTHIAVNSRDTVYGVEAEPWPTSATHVPAVWPLCGRLSSRQHNTFYNE